MVFDLNAIAVHATNTDRISDTVESTEQPSSEFATCPAKENLAKGKKNTEIMLVTVFIGLVGLVAVGYAIQNSKKKDNAEHKLAPQSKKPTKTRQNKRANQKRKKISRASKKLKALIFFLTVSVSTFLATTPARAICPVCTVAVGAGLGLSRYLGIDDTITSLWIGGIIVSTIFWTIDWLSKKGKKGLWIDILTTILMYVFVIIPLYWSKMIGHQYNKLWGIDKIVLGMIIGSIVFFLGARVHFMIKQKNKDKVFFPFQKVVIPVGSLWIMSLIFYFIIYY